MGMFFIHIFSSNPFNSIQMDSDEDVESSKLNKVNIWRLNDLHIWSQKLK